MNTTPASDVQSIQPYALRPKEAARYSGVTPDFLKRCRIYGAVDGVQGPPYRRISERVILYLVSDLDAWLTSFHATHHQGEEMLA